MITLVQAFNIGIAMAGLLICFCSLLQILFGANVDKRTENLFCLFFIIMILFVICHLLGLLMKGHLGAGFRAALYAVNFGEFAFPAILAFIVSEYLLSILDPKHNKKTIRYTILGLLLIHLAIVLISQFTGLLYTIDENNIYHRSEMYPLAYVMVMLMLTVNVYYLTIERRRLTNNEKIAFLIYFIIPSLSAVIQLYIYGISIIVFAISVSAFVMYVFILRDKSQRYYRQLDEISQLKTDIMISQVQPHFIFNSLTAIRSLCDMDSEAYDAIGHFAGFMRGNLELLNEKGCIPMSRELNTVDNYLYMEKLRFDDKLQISTDFKDTSFMIPACSVQVLAENAVKHGIRQATEGRGTLIMKSYESDDHHVIEVTDNGVGFDPDNMSSGTGIANLRRRLEIMCEGELVVQSESGKGTTAKILIPKVQRKAL